MMHYALTVRDNRITGVHSSAQPFKPGHFDANPKLADDIIMPFESGEYKTGHDLREYKDGKLRPIVDRVSDGLSKVPDGYEIIDNELVKRGSPVAEDVPSLLDMIKASDEKIMALESEVSNLKDILLRQEYQQGVVGI